MMHVKLFLMRVAIAIVKGCASVHARIGHGLTRLRAALTARYETGRRQRDEARIRRLRALRDSEAKSASWAGACARLFQAAGLPSSARASAWRAFRHWEAACGYERRIQSVQGDGRTSTREAA